MRLGASTVGARTLLPETLICQNLDELPSTHSRYFSIRAGGLARGRWPLIQSFPRFFRNVKLGHPEAFIVGAALHGERVRYTRMLPYPSKVPGCSGESGE